MGAYYDKNCLEFLSSTPTNTPAGTYAGFVSWGGQKNGLEPGEIYTTTVTFRALKTCLGNIQNSYVVNYYFTGSSARSAFSVRTETFLPILTSQ